MLNCSRQYMLNEFVRANLNECYFFSVLFGMIDGRKSLKKFQTCRSTAVNAVASPRWEQHRGILVVSVSKEDDERFSLFQTSQLNFRTFIYI